MVEYRSIEGFSGYRVGDDGSVWTNKRRGPGTQGGPWRRLKPRRPCSAHPDSVIVILFRDSRQYAKAVGKLVLETFGTPCPRGMECLHTDGDRSNNALDNLCWGVPGTNRRRAPHWRR